MPTTKMSTWYHSNTYTADSAFDYCAGIIRHEKWCVAKSEVVTYAYESILDADKLSLVDRIIPHALGVVWGGNVCTGSCKAADVSTATA